MAKNIEKKHLNTSWVSMGQITGLVSPAGKQQKIILSFIRFSFDDSEMDSLFLLDFSVVVINENDKVIGCTTGRLSTGASPLPPSQGRPELSSELGTKPLQLQSSSSPGATLTTPTLRLTQWRSTTLSLASPATLEPISL